MKIIHDIRSGLSFCLLSWALTVAPKDEQASLAMAIHQHVILTDGPPLHLLEKE